MRKLIQFGSLPPAKADTAPGHDSAIGHVTGLAAYIDDLPGPKGMHHLAVGLSPHASARLLHMDLSAVRCQPGVIDVITAADIPGHNEVGAVYPGDPLLAENEVRYAGQMVFAVVADTLYHARCAVAHALIDYQLQPPALDPVASIRDGLTVLPEHIHERPLPPPALDRGAAMSDDIQTSGNVDHALEKAAHVLEGEQFIGGQEHFYLEGQIAQAEALDDNGLRVLTSSQHPSEVQKLVAEVLAMPLHAIVAEVRRMGGGFGGKESQAAALGAMAALAAHRNGCAVRFRLPRADDMQATGKRHPFHNRYRVGFDDTGRLTGADITLIGNCGHSPDLSEGVVDRAMFHADNAYYLGDARVTGHRAMTHTASNTAFRGFGGPQGMMPIEGAMDDIARSLGVDPLDVRKRNLYDNERCETHYGQQIDQPLIKELIETLEASSDYRTRRRDITAFNAKSPIIRKGLALTPVKFGISFTAQHLNQAGALLMIYTDGSVLVNHGGTEMGQGLHTKVCQVVARELGIAYHRVRISATRTDKVPNTSPTAASSGADLNAMAARDAAITLRERLVDFAADWQALKREQLRLEADGLLAGKARIEWPELIQQAYLARVSLSATGFYATPEIHYDRKTGRGRPFYYFAWGAAVSEVHVDTLTGEYRVARVDILHDVGDSLNPAIDRGQIEGGFVQGMGWLTTEELKWDAEGHLLTTGPATYKIPACGDAPRDFRVALLEGHPNSQATIYRSKAVGEPPLMLAISVWSALRDAIASLTDDRSSPRLDTPATPERVLMACRAIREARVRSAPSPREEASHVMAEK
ncbi:xanthine dehydrogenase molybdopterin binding subunit [Kushneria phyllosphaerae]|uniref:Putative xanthine dehydrogenase subunit D n=1 Tax=Kushneria phyllosphaerae TaxID=2100822 RepID=A0A2R8CJR1_9GAMM|nr:xanthine dehydrogenase molybdopterin binding subunit [Kushneria phyllosphaerae]SPJ33126.1 putative xanthine dehydrogenase subunit D [Kushneria phyllosphaerae]